jgi:uncharacterized RDD family membrane protein YckC
LRTKPNLKKRIIATVIDYGLYLLFFFAYVMNYGHPNNEGGYTINGLAAFVPEIVWFFYFIVLESFFQGTPGHLASGLKIFTVYRQNIDISHSIKRHLLDPIDILIYGIPAIISIRNTEKNQRLGDLWAKTIVVDTTDPEQFVTGF